ncbi:MAG TPA: protein kinase [Thermoanaerobaculia bacterium]|nr:protein kinase [Thermoanaerobaculia bacterium]
MNLSPGVRVGSYEIVAPLGAGGMGEVYRARDERLARDIALKILSGDLSESSDHLYRFEQEARAASALNHPNIITIYDIGRIDGLAYIAMELIEGRDVRSILAAAPLPLKQALRIAVKVADGLAVAHERGIVHRDLKPENLMVSRDGYVKILDFGLAKLVRPFTDKDSTMPHTTPGAVFGTVGYMSPEQAAGREIDFRSDQFALGVILYEMVTGRMPFIQPTAAETLASIIRDDPPPATNFNEKVPPELLRIVDRLLAKDPQERYASTRDLARDLREVRDRITNSSSPRYRSDGVLQQRGRRAVSVSVTIAVVVLILAAGAMIMRRGPSPAPPGSPVIAVTPFADRTGTEDGRAFADGFAEMIASRLDKSPAIAVVPAFDSSVAGRFRDPLELARNRGATMALGGAVQRGGGRVDVNYSLVDVANGVQIAGATFSESAENVFSMAERLSDSVLAALKATPVSPGSPGAPMEMASTSDESAYVEVVGLLQRSTDEKSVDRAVSALERLLGNSRDSALLNAQMARALLNKAQLTRRPGLIEQATIFAERAAEIDGSIPEVHVRLGHVRLAAGRHREAAASFERALQLEHDNPDAVLGMAATHEVMGRAANAESMYQKAIALRPHHANTFNRYAVFLFNSGRYEDAAANFQRFTELLPTPRGYSNLAATYLAIGRYDDAEIAAKKSIELEPNSDAHVNLGDVYFYTGRFKEASAALERSTVLAPASYQAWRALGDAYRWTAGLREKSVEPYEKAIATAREALAINPRDHAAHSTIAVSLARLGRLDAAAEASATALKIDPTSQSALYAAGVVAHSRGMNDVAVSWLERARQAGYPRHFIERDPDLEPLRDRLK